MDMAQEREESQCDWREGPGPVLEGLAGRAEDLRSCGLCVHVMNPGLM